MREAAGPKTWCRRCARWRKNSASGSRQTPAGTVSNNRARSGKVGTGFPKRSCSNKKIERHDDSKKSHPALSPDDRAPRSSHRPLRNKAFGLGRLDLVPFAENPDPEIRVGVPERPRRFEAGDWYQHLLQLPPAAGQRHRVAARRPGVAETDHAADIRKPEGGFEDGQREDDVFAGVGRAMF